MCLLSISFRSQLLEYIARISWNSPFIAVVTLANSGRAHICRVDLRLHTEACGAALALRDGAINPARRHFSEVRPPGEKRYQCATRASDERRFQSETRGVGRLGEN